MTKITVATKLSGKAKKKMEAGFERDSASKKVPLFKQKELELLCKSADGNIFAGLHAKIWWDWIYIDVLWVDEDHRGNEIGARLVRRAEKEAMKKGCHGSYLWTQSWQAPGFYKKLGYKKFVVMKDFPKGHQRIGFMKRLAA